MPIEINTYVVGMQKTTGRSKKIHSRICNKIVIIVLGLGLDFKIFA